MKVNQCKKFDRSILIHYCADSLEAWTGQCTLGHQNPQDIYLLFITNWVSNATSIQDIFHTSEVFIDDEWKINSSYNHKGFVWWREQGILLKWTVQCVMSSYKSCSSQHCTFTSIYIYILVLGKIILLPLSIVLKTWNRKIIRSKVHLIHHNNSKY